VLERQKKKREEGKSAVGWNWGGGEGLNSVFESGHPKSVRGRGCLEREKVCERIGGKFLGKKGGGKESDEDSA